MQTEKFGRKQRKNHQNAGVDDDTADEKKAGLKKLGAAFTINKGVPIESDDAAGWRRRQGRHG